MAREAATRGVPAMDAMLTTNPFDVSGAEDDHLHEECGVIGVYGADGAAALCALGLHALQHRVARKRRALPPSTAATSIPTERWAMSRAISTRMKLSASCAATSPSATTAMQPPARLRCATSSRCTPNSPAAASRSATTAISRTRLSCAASSSAAARSSSRPATPRSSSTSSRPAPTGRCSTSSSTL